jgi:hypothetical protein
MESEKETRPKELDPASFPHGKTASEHAVDLWAHRSVGLRCKSCMWFAAKISGRVQRADHIIGRCRRHAPSMHGYPVVFSDDWCGDHKMDENAI